MSSCMLLDAYVFDQARRYDIKGKMHLRRQEKLYLVDQGFRGVLLRGRSGDISHLLENIVYLECIRVLHVIEFLLGDTYGEAFPYPSVSGNCRIMESSHA